MLHVICGAPCAGKTSYVEKHASEGALVIDTDKIANAFGGSEHQASGHHLKVALDARSVAIDHALKSGADTWLIDTLPNEARLKQYQDAGAEVVLIDTPIEECFTRAQKRPQGTREAIEKWRANSDSLFNNVSIRRVTMSETVNQVNTNTAEPERTFTQEEMDAIIGDRLKRERAKYADYDSLREKASKYDEIEEQSKSMLQRETERADGLQKELDDMKKASAVRELRERIANETGVPYQLLTADTEDGCAEQAKAILSFAKPDGYPSVKDGGETRHSPGKKSTRDQFAEFMKDNF